MDLTLTLSWPLEALGRSLSLPQLLSCLSSEMRTLDVCVRHLEAFWVCTGTPGEGVCLLAQVCVVKGVDMLELSSNCLITLGDTVGFSRV